jgi:hypothetical protein
MLKWSLEEEVLLIDLYYQITNLTNEEQEFKIKNLSSILRKRAVMLGVNVDDLYRNTTGIRMKLQNVTYIDTYGRFGLSSYSKMDKEIVEMYKLNKNKFNKILTGIKGKYMNNKSAFYEWLVKEESNIMSDIIITLLCKTDEHAYKTKKTLKSLWEINEIDEVNHYFQKIFSSRLFRIKYKLQGFDYIHAISCYKKFLEWHNEMQSRNNHENDNLHIIKKTEAGLDDTLINFDTNMKSELNEATRASYKEYEKVLSEKFPRGYKLGASIEVKKFRMFYKDIFGRELCDEDDTIQKIIAEVGIEYEDSRIMSPNNAIDEKILSIMIDYIDDIFNSGKTMIYYKSLYEKFQQELMSTNVYNDKILKQVLAYFIRDKYFFKRFFITPSLNTEADPVIEIKELLMSNIVPMSYEEIEREFSHIPLTKLKYVMSQNPEFINTERNYYTHIQCICFNDDDIAIINHILDESIDKSGYITREEIINKLKQNNPHTIEKNASLTSLGLGNAIAYYFNQKYDSNGAIFSKKGTNLSLGKILNNYCLNKTYVDLNELEIFAKELGFPNLPGVYLSEIFTDFARINKNILIRKDKLIFDVMSVDSVLDKFCNKDYIAISEIKTFALFPSNEYPWNIFLLESYVKNFSLSYKYISDSISLNKCIGAIVKMKSSFYNYEQILIDLLSSVPQGYLTGNKSALDYLYENGFIAKRRMSNIEKIIKNAKIMTYQKGNI